MSETPPLRNIEVVGGGSPVQGMAVGHEVGPGNPEPRETEFTVVARSQWQNALRRFLARKSAVVSLVLFVAIVLFAFVGGAVWHYKFDKFTNDLNSPPSLKHPFGTDSSGFDTLSEVLRGTQRSLEIAVFVAFVSTFVGTLYGAIAGYSGGRLDSFMMRVADLFLVFPAIAIAGVVTHTVGTKASGWIWIAGILAALTWPYVARIVRGSALAIREKEYVEASRALGATQTRIILRHVVPNVIGQVIVTVTILMATAILAETSLSFVGLGVQAPDTSLGLLISNAQTAVETRPWLFYFPGIFIILIALTVNFVGDGLREALDPTARRVRS
jgi:peptide/nickel transport system permease protein